MSECVIADFFDYTEPVAKKAHRCCECFAPILKGEKHFKGWGRWEFGAATYRQHLLCMEACMLIRDNFNGGDCIAFGALKEEFSEMRWQYDRARDKHKPWWVKLRKLMAQIRWRERKSKRA